MRFRLRRDKPDPPEEPDGSAEETADPEPEAVEISDHGTAVPPDPDAVEREPDVATEELADDVLADSYTLDALGLALDDDELEVEEVDDALDDVEPVEVPDGAIALVVDQSGEEVVARVRILNDRGAMLADEFDQSGALVRIFEPVEVIGVISSK